MKKLIDTMKNYGFSNEVIAGVLGNIKVECDFKLQAENMYYSKAETLMKTFPSKFKHMSTREIETYTKNPQKLGDYVYKDQLGFKYRGRGYFQLTGIANYKAYSEYLKLDLVNNPDLALREDIAILIVIEFIKHTAFKYVPKLNEIEDINYVADIITKSVQGYGKNYNVGFLKEHLEKKRNYAIRYYKDLQINDIIGG
jgi:predicted chitinase